MKIINPLQMNDWDIKKFLLLIFSIQFMVWGMVCLNSINISIPLLRQMICFIYLIFIPGILILRILRLHNLGNIETVLYSAGLSISSLMFVGLIVNTVCPLMGFKNPISLYSLIVSISLLVLVLCVLSYIYDKNFSNPSYFEIREITSLQFLCLSITPFLAIFGTYLMNLYKINDLIMILIIVLSSIPILVTFDKIKEKYYPFAIFTISISLLFFVSLISNYVVGGDIVAELYTSNIVVQNGIWNPSITPDIKPALVLNSMLSIVFLAPILSLISDLNLMWVFKIFYPLIYCLVPLGLYKLYKEQTSPKIAFLATFFFVATFSFYSEMITLARQQIAELFFVILLLIIIKNFKKIEFSILFLLFSGSLIVSHYGLSYIFILYVTCFILLFYLLKFTSTKLPNCLSNLKVDLNFSKVNTITKNFFLFFIVSCIFWYIYTSNASVFYSIVHIVDNIISNIYSDFLNPEYVQGVAIIQSTQTLMYSVTKYLHLVFQFFITFGLFSVLFLRNRINKIDINLEYLLLSIVSFLILILSITVPYFSGSLQTSRMYHITQFLLAPFSIIGFLVFFEIINKFISGKKTKVICKNYNFSLKLISILLAIFLLFNSGLMYELSDEKKITTSLISFEPDYNFPVYNDNEFMGAEWLYAKKSNGIVYSDKFRSPLFVIFGIKSSIFSKKAELSFSVPNSYVFMGKWNIMANKFVVSSSKGMSTDYDQINNSNIIYNKNKIYSNNGTEIYL